VLCAVWKLETAHSLVTPKPCERSSTLSARFDPMTEQFLQQPHAGRSRTNSLVTPEILLQQHQSKRREKASSGQSRNRKKSSTLRKKSSKAPKGPASETITYEEERQCTYKIRSLLAATRKRDELSLTKSENDTTQPTEEEWAEACGLTVVQLRIVMQEGRKARAKLVDSHARLVNIMAKKYFRDSVTKGSIIGFEDLVQEGNLGILQAADRFDPERGVRFRTYASYWIRQRIFRSLSQYSRPIRLPRKGKSRLENHFPGPVCSDLFSCSALTVFWMACKIQKEKQYLENVLGRLPSLDELAKHLEITVEKLQFYTVSLPTSESLDTTVSFTSRDGSEISERTLDSVVCHRSTEQQKSTEELAALRRTIAEVLDGLEDKEREVLRTRYGLNDGAPKSAQATGNRLGLSIDQVKAFEAKALTKLRSPRHNHKLKEYATWVDEDDITELAHKRIWAF